MNPPKSNFLKGEKMEKKYSVRILTPNKFIEVKGKLVRTPTRFIITEREVSHYKTIIHSNSISKFSIEEVKKETKKEKKGEEVVLVESVVESLPISENKVIVEELDSSTLGSFLKTEE